MESEIYRQVFYFRFFGVYGSRLCRSYCNGVCCIYSGWNVLVVTREMCVRVNDPFLPVCLSTSLLYLI